METGRIQKASNALGHAVRRRISAAEWMGAERAEALVASAEAEAGAVRAAAAEVRAAAVAEGRAEGLREAACALERRLTELALAQARWGALAEAEALELAVEMARRILGRELRLDPGAAAAGALAALRAAGIGGRLRVRLHPESAAELRLRLPSLSPQAGEGGLELVSDPALLPGDVVVETAGGQVDGRIDSRLEGFRAALGQAAA